VATRLVVETRLTPATGKAERQAALDMVEAQAGGSHPTVAGDKAYDTHGFVASVRALGVTPHVAQNTARRGGSAIDERTTRHPDIPRVRPSANAWRRFLAG
jgi:hypothetical protein